MGKHIFLLLITAFLTGTACKDQKSEHVTNSLPTEMPIEEALKEASRNYLMAWSGNDTSLLKEIAIRNIVRNVNGEITSSSHKELIKAMKFWHTALPDFKVEEKEIIVEGNRAYINWTSTGTNTGMFGEITPTGKKSKTEGFSILTFDDSGQLIHENVYYDLLGVMQDWGYSMSPPNME